MLVVINCRVGSSSIVFLTIVHLHSTLLILLQEVPGTVYLYAYLYSSRFFCSTMATSMSSAFLARVKQAAST